MAYFNKLKWILGFLMVFALIFATNRLDKENFKRINSAIDTIYEDRLVASELLFDMADVMHQKEIKLLEGSLETRKESQKLDSKIQSMLTSLSKTRLTEKESSLLSSLQKQHDSLKETQDSNAEISDETRSKLIAQLRRMKETVRGLSDVQLEEGSKQVVISKGATENMEFTTKMEYYLLGFLALIIQFIIMYSPTKSDTA